MNIKDRIVEMRRVRASELRPNPRNYHTHPELQRNALRGVLDEIGIADALLAYDPGDGGGLMLIDGHARAEETGDTEWPVLVLDLTTEEADYLLATLDPLASLASANSEALDELLHNVNSENAAVQEMLAGLAESIDSDGSDPKFVKLDTQPPPNMTWVLIGIPTIRLGEINDSIEQIANLPGVLCEMSANDTTQK